MSGNRAREAGNVKSNPLPLPEDINNGSTSYSGDISWNEVYRTHYNLAAMAALVEALTGPPNRIVFSGFGQLAAMLSKSHSVHFVEYSESMVRAAKREFAEIGRISHADILDIVEDEDAPVVLVLCRISAYWQEAWQLSHFLDRVRRHPRDLIAIDFFDAERLEGGGTLGNPDFLSAHSIETRTPKGTLRITLATSTGEYKLVNRSVHYEEQRAYYDSGNVLELARGYLPDYEVEVATPIVEGDPGFTLVARRSAKL